MAVSSMVARVITDGQPFSLRMDFYYEMHSLYFKLFQVCATYHTSVTVASSYITLAAALSGSLITAEVTNGAKSVAATSCGQKQDTMSIVLQIINFKMTLYVGIINKR